MIQLMDHQEAWVGRVLHGDLSGIIEEHGLPLFGEAGTGKTHPAAEVAAELLGRHGGHALFVVPTRLVWNWEHEIRRMRPELSNLQLLVVHGTRRERMDQLVYLNTLMPLYSMYVIVGYDALRIEQQQFQSLKFTTLFADEAHRIKNRVTQASRALKSIDATFRFALSGTPITNRPNDLWSIAHFLDPGPPTLRTTASVPPRPKASCPLGRDDKKNFREHGCPFCEHWQGAEEQCAHGANTQPKPPVRIRYRGASPTWGDYEGFIRRYCRIHTVRVPYTDRSGQRRYRQISQVTGGKNMGELHHRLVDFGMERWLIDDVLQLQPLVFRHIRLEPTTEERRNYARVEGGIINFIEAQEEGLTLSQFTRLSPLALRTYLRQCTVLTPTAFAAIRGGLLDEVLEYIGRLSQSDTSSKEEWILSFLEDTGDEKVLIYGHWIGALDHLMSAITSNGIRAVGIYGPHNKSPRDATRIMEQFATDPKLRVIVGNESMSEGINLQAARYVIFMHLPDVPKDVVQYIGRAHRFGQKRTVVVYFLSHLDTIDETMAEQCLRKQVASDAIFDPGFAGRASMFDVNTPRGLLDMLRGREGRNV